LKNFSTLVVPTLGWISESPLITAHLSKPLWEADLHVNEERKKKKTIKIHHGNAKSLG